jgi:hypothetical protein
MASGREKVCSTAVRSRLSCWNDLEPQGILTRILGLARATHLWRYNLSDGATRSQPSWGRGGGCNGQ